MNMGTFYLLAGAPQGAEAGGTGSMISTFLPFLLIIGIFYFLIILPQRRKGKIGGNFIRTLLQGRTEEQQKVIKYFLAPRGCLSKNISDGEYEKLVLDKVANLNHRQRALEKTGVDESQVNEIEPVHFENYYFAPPKDKGYHPGNHWVKKGIDGKWRTSAYQVSWLFFSNDQVYVYQYTLNMNDDEKNERTEEYFYRDIVNFSTASESAEKETTIEKKGCLGIGAGTEIVRKIIDTDKFSLIVPGDRFDCALTKDDYTEERIVGMKAKLREKKG